MVKQSEPQFTEMSMLVEPGEEIIRHQHMDEVISCRKSKLTVDAWCKRRGISKSTFYRWEKEIQETVCDTLEEQSALAMLAPHFVQVPTVSEFTDSGASTQGVETAIRIQMGQSVIEIQGNTDVHLAETVVRVVVEKC